MMKRLCILLTALLLLCGMTALAEENVYDLIENALYRIVLRTETGDEPLGSALLFSDKQILLTSAGCIADGPLYAIGPDGEHAISAAQAVDQSGIAMLEMATPADATPLHLAAEDAAGMAALFGVAQDGTFIIAPLNQVRSSIYQGQSAMVLSSSEGLLPGSFLTDEKGNLIALTIAQQTEGQGAYIALDANGLYRAITRQQYEKSFLPVEAVWQNGVLTLTWTDVERGSGTYLITLSGDDNPYYTFFEADHTERTITLTVPPEHRYDFQVQWAEDAASAIEPVWGAMSEYFIPGADFGSFGYTQVCSVVTRKDATSPIEHIDQPTLAVLTDASVKKYLHVKASYDVDAAIELPMTIELIAPNGQFFFESAVHTLSPDKEKEDAFLLPLDDLLADCAEFSGGALKTGQYLLRYAIAGSMAGEYAFTLAEGTAQEEADQQEPDQPAATSGFITDVDIQYDSGALTLTWDGEAIPEDAPITVFYMYEGNNYYVYHQEMPGAIQTEIFTVPGRETIIWIRWALESMPAQEPEQESDYLVVPAAPEAPFTLNGFENQRTGLMPSSDPYAVEKGEFLPQVELTREILMDASTPIYFQTEDTYQVEEMSEDHPMVIVLCTPEGLCFTAPLLYIFDPALQSSDLWLTDISALCRDYESLICGAWPAGHYRLMYCIDGQIAGEYHFTLE